MEFLLGFIIGLIIGGITGMTLMTLCVISKDIDDSMNNDM